MGLKGWNPTEPTTPEFNEAQVGVHPAPFPSHPGPGEPHPSNSFQNKKLRSSAINAGAVVTLLKVFFPCMTKDGKSCG